MTVIRTTCPRCGEVEMTPEAILLSLRSAAGDASYRFLCPTCLDPVEKRADQRIVALLVSAGVDLAEGAAQAEFEMDGGGEAPAPARSDAPVFTVDDVINFHFLLQDEDKIREFLAG